MDNMTYTIRMKKEYASSMIEDLKQLGAIVANLFLFFG